MACALALLAASGCAIHTARSEHYFGPVLHRRVAVCDRGADVTEVLRVGPLAEVGRQSGLAFGVVDRVAVVPHEPVAEQCTPRDDSAWRVSPLYLRIRHREEPRLVWRMLVGVQAAVGAETTALSIGGVATTLMHPPDDAFVRVRFDAGRPMQTRFTMWSVHSGAELADAEILEETP